MDNKVIHLQSIDSKTLEKIGRISEEINLRRGLGEEKYTFYESLAKEGRFDEISEQEMRNDRHNPEEKLGYHFIDDLLNPRSFFRNKYNSS